MISQLRFGILKKELANCHKLHNFFFQISEVQCYYLHVLFKPGVHLVSDHRLVVGNTIVYTLHYIDEYL